MAEIKGTTTISTGGKTDPLEFLNHVGDAALLKFLQRLPMVGGMESGKMTMADLIFEMKLWPFVIQAWHVVDGTPGIPGRLMQLSRVYKMAEADLQRETGARRRVPRVIDATVFAEIYRVDGLP